MERFHRTEQVLIETKSQYDEMCTWVRTRPWIVVDAETTGFDLRGSDTILGIGVGDMERQYWVRYKQFHQQPLWDALHAVPRIVAQNIKFDLMCLSSVGWKPLPTQHLSDTLVLARLVVYDKFPSLDLPSLLGRFYSPREAMYDFHFKNLLKKHKAKQFDGAGWYNLGVYCCNDVRTEAMLYISLLEKVKSYGLEDSLWKMQERLTATLFRMEDKGMRVDVDYCKKSISRIEDRVHKIEQNILLEAGEKEMPNFRSNQQLTTFFGKLGIVSPIKTKTGYSWSEDAMIQIDHPIMGMIREMRTLNHMADTYFGPYLKLKDSNDRIHPNFKNWGTVTGRRACAQPNVQNLPKMKMEFGDGAGIIDEDAMNKVKALFGAKNTTDTSGVEETHQGGSGGTFMSWLSHLEDDFDEERHISVRRAFIPDDGKVLWGADYSQLEMRMFFSYLNNPEYSALVSGRDWDAHDWVVEIVWGLQKDHEDFDFYRSLAKAINFGLIYGIGVKKLANQIGKSIDETKEFRKMYFDRIPEVDKMSADIEKTLRQRGYVKNRFGRRYSVIPDKTYLLTNYLVQGSGGDFVGSRMNAADEFLVDMPESNLISEIHDELVYEIEADHAEELTKQLLDIQEQKKFGVLFAADPNVYQPSLAQKAK